MKITIETSDSERIALQPQTQPLLSQGQGTGSSVDLAATDGGPPGAELLQSLSERRLEPTAAATTEAKQSYRMGMSDDDGVSNGGSPQSRH